MKNIIESLPKRQYNHHSFIWDTDAYKLGHMCQYPKDTEYVYSVLQLRSNKTFKETPIVGLQYLIKEYLMQPINVKDIDALIAETIEMGIYHPETERKLYSLADLGYLPIEIKALPEGTIIENPNAICTIQNTVKGYHWCVGFVETLILKWWSVLTGASTSLKYRRLVEKYFSETSDSTLTDFTVHDFGSRGCASPEHAALSGLAHLLSFKGSDTIASIPVIRNHYNCKEFFMGTVPASEHAVMCSFGRENEIEAFRNMLKTYPTGIVSIVSDTYNFYNVMDNMVYDLKDEIMNRDGKVVFRPDSGNPFDIIIGENHTRIEDISSYGSKEIGAIRALDKAFGHTVNSKGYKVLNAKVGLIYGDGMYLERYEKVLKSMKELGYSAENLVIGVGGILRDGSRDTLGAAFKATCVKRSGEWIPICKDPITDPGKKSFKGFVSVVKEDGHYVTKEGILDDSLLETVFKDGKLIKEFNWEQVKELFESHL